VTHPSSGLLARYALGDVSNEAELRRLEDHLLECLDCQRRAIAIDLIGTIPDEEAGGLCLHVAATSGDASVALCGADASRNVISRDLLPGLDRAVVCPKCLAAVEPVN
jgi:hypothetical protein